MVKFSMLAEQNNERGMTVRLFVERKSCILFFGSPRGTVATLRVRNMGLPHICAPAGSVEARFKGRVTGGTVEVRGVGVT